MGLEVAAVSMWNPKFRHLLINLAIDSAYHVLYLKPGSWVIEW